jgi:hypothetical protein
MSSGVIPSPQRELRSVLGEVAEGAPVGYGGTAVRRTTFGAGAASIRLALAATRSALRS